MSAEPSQEALIAAWTSAVETRDGSKLRIRPLESRDREREIDFVDRLSPATRYYRLLTPLKFLPPHLLDQLMDVDYRSRMAFVATCDGGGTERFVGLARYGETDRPDTVELGITVADAWQHRGVARVLMPVLLEYAHARILDRDRYGVARELPHACARPYAGVYDRLQRTRTSHADHEVAVMTVRILALNCGSSSVKCALFDGDVRLFEARVEDAGAVDEVLAKVRAQSLAEPEAVVHRIVHGGERFVEPTRIDDSVLAALDELSRLAPLHNPPAVAALRRAREIYPRIPHVAVFDTAFHASLPPHVREYALPRDVREQFGIRRFGFHGINHANVAAHFRSERVVSCHLGNGASVAAIERGRSVETSMGLTPLEGLVMGTRGGDLDPGVVLELMRTRDRAALDHLLNTDAGLKGLTGTHDMREVERRAAAGDEDCRLAIDIYVHRIRKYIGAYVATLGGVDVIAFTGGVGEGSALVRERCLERFAFLGIALDADKNRAAHPNQASPLIDIAAATSSVRLCVVRADEEAEMARQAAKLLD
jgi:acetate kinase